MLAETKDGNPSWHNGDLLINKQTGNTMLYDKPCLPFSIHNSHLFSSIPTYYCRLGNSIPPAVLAKSSSVLQVKQKRA